MLVGGVLGVLLLSVAAGCHIEFEDGLEGHLESFHPAPYDSTVAFCIDEISGDVSLLDARDWISDAFNGDLLNGYAGWDSVSGVGFQAYYDCADLTLSERANLDITFHLVASTPLGSSYMAEPFEIASDHYGHENWDHVEIWFRDDDLLYSTSYRGHTINHETGHAFGLADAVSSKQYMSNATTCLMMADLDGNGSHDYFGPVPSIMHNGNSVYETRGHCGEDVVGNPNASFGNLPFPTAFDLLIVELIATMNPLAMDQYEEN